MWQTYYLAARDLMAQREADAAADRLAHVARGARLQRPWIARRVAAQVAVGLSRGAADVARRLDDRAVVDRHEEMSSSTC